MQIEVVDDCSTVDDPEKVVREVGKGRVAFHRNPKNSGYCTLNFNICIQRSIGQLVHILHGDDFVLPGFYAEVESLSTINSQHALYTTRSLFVNEQGQVTSISRNLQEINADPTNTKHFISGNPLQFSAVVTRRSFFERFGGFHETLVHCADWEMWYRAIKKGKGTASGFALSCYRVFDGSDTCRLISTAENLYDTLRLYLFIKQQDSSFAIEVALRALYEKALRQAKDAGNIGVSNAAESATVFAAILAEPPGWWEKKCIGLLDKSANRLKKQAELINLKRFNFC
jgi:GT2 family glycosyltransferase